MWKSGGESGDGLVSVYRGGWVCCVEMSFRHCRVGGLAEVC